MAADSLADAAAAGLGLTLGYAAGGPTGAAFGSVVGAASTAPLRYLAARVRDELSRDIYRRQGQVIAAAAEHAGVDDETVIEWCARDERSRLTTALAFDAAARSTYAPKAILLGRALAESLQEKVPAQLDLHQQMIDVLAHIEAVHVEVLDHLTRRPWGLGGHEKRHEAAPGASSGHTLVRLAQCLPHLAPGLDGVVATLVTTGLVISQPDVSRAVESGVIEGRRNDGTGNPTRQIRVDGVEPLMKVTPLGRLICDHVSQAGGLPSTGVATATQH